MPSVLVVDDSPIDRRLAMGLFSRTGAWETNQAEDGALALAAIEAKAPQLVVTDLNMPNMDGLELVSALKRQFPKIPVILMTAQGSEDIAVQALQAGAASYVPKRKLALDLVNVATRVLSSAETLESQERVQQTVVRQFYEMVLNNNLDEVASVPSFLQGHLKATGIIAESDLVRVSVALEEALLNAMFHGNLEISSEVREDDHAEYYKLARARATEAPFRDRRIFVSAELTASGATYVIRDQGPGFSRDKLPDPTDPINIERCSGRGLLLMQTFMDEVHYNDKGNEVTLIKRRKAS